MTTLKSGLEHRVEQLEARIALIERAIECQLAVLAIQQLLQGAA